MRVHPSTTLNTIAALGASLAVPGLVFAASHAQVLPARPAAVNHGPALGSAPVASSLATPSATPLLAGWKSDFDDDTLENTWSWSTAFSATGPFESRVIFNYVDDSHYMMLRIAGVGRNATMRFWQVYRGKTGEVKVEKLGDPEAALPNSSGQLTVQRQAWRIRALWNGRVLVGGTLVDSGQKNLKFGTAVQGKATLGAPRMQPTAPVLFRDDFMRAQGPDDPEVPGQWHRVAGVWKTSGILGPRADALRNPNPFVFRSEASSDMAMRPEATVGDWFWSDYSVQASVRPQLSALDAPLTAGLSAYRQDDGTAVVGEVDFQTGTARLRQGNTILAESKPFLTDADQWHRLFLEPGPGTMRLVVDGVERVRYSLGESTSGGALAQGPAGLVSQVGGGNYIDFDDVRLADNDSFSDDFTTRSVGRWNDAIGGWQTQSAITRNGKTVQAAQRIKLTVGPAVTLSGAATHDSGQIEAQFQPHDAGGAPYGVVFAAKDAGNYMLARVLPTTVQIVQFANGSGHILGASPKAATNNALNVQWQDGAITAASGKASATANVNTIADGRAGAWADGSAGDWALQNFQALGAAPSWGEASLPDIFMKDRLMQYWAANASLWQTADGDKSGARWHVGDFFNDATLSIPMPAMADGQGFTMYAGGSAATPEAGTSLIVLRAGDKVTFTLKEQGKAVNQDSLPADIISGQTLRLARRPLGDGRVALRVALPIPLPSAEAALAPAPNPPSSYPAPVSAIQPIMPVTDAGIALLVAAHPGLAATVKDDAVAAGNSKVGIVAVEGAPIDWDNALAHTANVIDYSFTNAPTDWRSSKGDWAVSERWTCSPQWGFFAGVKSVSPTIWSRFATKGDWTLEAYIASPMDITRSERGPHDLNVTVDADGRDLASGYSFLFSSTNGTTNRAYRGDQLVQEAPFALPTMKGSTHQDWFYVRIERRATPAGLNYRYSVDGQQIFNYTDPKPLANAASLPGHIAFWTYNGGLSIARVRLWHSGLDSGQNDAPVMLASAPHTPTALASASAVALKNPLGQWDSRRINLLMTAARITPLADPKSKGVAITDAESGGDWTTYVSRTPFDAAAHPALSFRYKIPAGVLVNLYAHVDGRWREIGFTGDSTTLPQHLPDLTPAPNSVDMGWGADTSAGMNIGKIDNVVADNTWHQATFDLLTALKDSPSAIAGTTVDALAFAAPDRDYLRAGLGGNHLGSTYSIADFDAPAPGGGARGDHARDQGGRVAVKVEANDK